MGKVRDGFNDIDGLAQWIGRKLVNHDPMSIRESQFPTNQRVRKKVLVGRVKDEPQHIIYALPSGKRFVLSVREMELDEELPQLVAVGS